MRIGLYIDLNDVLFRIDYLIGASDNLPNDRRCTLDQADTPSSMYYTLCQHSNLSPFKCDYKINTDF